MRIRTGIGPNDWSENVPSSANLRGYRGQMVAEIAVSRPSPIRNPKGGSGLCERLMANGRTCGSKPGHRDHCRAKP